MKIVNKEDVLNLYKQLLPWEQEEVKATLGVDLSSLSEEEILRRFNIDPIDHVEAKDCYETLSDAIINYYYTWELFDEIDERRARIADRTQYARARTIGLQKMILTALRRLSVRLRKN